MAHRPLVFSFSTQLLSGSILINHSTIGLKFGNMINADLKLCKRVSKFKMADSKGPLGHAEICPNFVRTSSW